MSTGILCVAKFPDMAITATGVYSPALTRRRSNAPEKAMGPTKIAAGVTVFFPTASSFRSLPVRASKPEREEVNSNINDPTVTSQDDLNYLLKLGGGSVLGAAAIKYGSALFPEITRPNILQALIMISAPVIVAILLLIRESREE